MSSRLGIAFLALFASLCFGGVRHRSSLNASSGTTGSVQQENEGQESKAKDQEAATKDKKVPLAEGKQATAKPAATAKPGDTAKPALGDIFDVLSKPSKNSGQGAEAAEKPGEVEEADGGIAASREAAPLGLFDALDDAKPIDIGEPIAEPEAADQIEPMEGEAEEAEGIWVADVVVEEAFGFVAEAQVGDPVVVKAMQHLSVRKSLVRRCCQLTEKQAAGMAGLNQGWVKAQLAGQKVPPPNNGLFMGVMQMFGAAPQRRPREENTQKAYRLIKSIESAMKETLDGPQLEAYEQEIASQLDFRRQAYAALYLTLMESHIYLSEDQKASLAEELSKSLRVEEQVYFQFYFQNNQRFLPTVPAAARKLLDPEQLRVLNGLNTYVYDALQWEMQMIQHQPLIVIEDK